MGRAAVTKLVKCYRCFGTGIVPIREAVQGVSCELWDTCPVCAGARRVEEPDDDEKADDDDRAE